MLNYDAPVFIRHSCGRDVEPGEECFCWAEKYSSKILKLVMEIRDEYRNNEEYGRARRLAELIREWEGK